MTLRMIALTLVLVAGLLLLASARSRADGGAGNRGGSSSRVEGRQLRLSIRIAETRNGESARLYYKSLARRHMWRAVRLPIPSR